MRPPDDHGLALREARRVLRLDGLLFAVVISAYASTIVSPVKDWVWNQDYIAVIREEILTGQHRRPEIVTPKSRPYSTDSTE
jgi:hypothetical protein